MKNNLKFAILAGLFIIPFIPFLVSSSLFFPFITTKAFVFRIIIEVIFAAWVLLALLDKDYRPRKSPLLYAALAFLGVMGLANLFGVDPLRSFWSNFERMEGYVTLLHLGAFFLVMGSVFREEMWKKWWNTSLFASGLMVFYCLFQLGGAVTINQGGVRVDGTFGNASYLAVYMLIHIFVASMFMWREWRRPVLRYSYLALVLGQLIILYHTATRGAILGLLGGVLVVALLNIRNREEQRVRKISISLFAGVLLIVGGFFALKDTALVTGSPVLSRFATISTEEIKSGGRSFVWPMAIEGFKERPILGWGQDNFIYVFQKHYSPEMYHLEPWFDRAHNIFLDWMVAGGLLGIITYLALYGVTLYTIWRPASPNRGERDGEMPHMEKSILTGLLAAYFFHNFFVFDHLISYILFFAIMAYVYSRGTGPALFERVVSEGVSKKAWLPALALLLIFTLYLVNFRAIGVNSSLIGALKARQTNDWSGAVTNFQSAVRNSYLGREEIVSQVASNATALLTADVPMEEKNNFYSFVRRAVVAEADRDPEYAKSQIVAGSFLASTGATEEALAYLNRAKLAIPGKQAVYFEIGSAYISNDQPRDALAVFKEAYEMAPNYREAKLIYLIGAIYAGDRVLERELLTQMQEEEVVFEDRLVSAYYNNGRTNEVITIFERRKVLDPANAARYDEYINQVRGSR